MSQTEKRLQEKHKVDANQKPSGIASFLSLPAPLRAVFDRFPLQTLPPNPLPQQECAASGNVLWIYATKEAAARGDPSFNPGCLKWQTYLILKGIDFSTHASNNHASLSGALPFLLPASHPSHTSEQISPISSTRLQEWTEKANPKSCERFDIHQEALFSMLDHRLRDAWLYNLYLCPENFESVAFPLYIASATNSPLVRASLARTLQHAARAELIKSGQVLDHAMLLEAASAALRILTIRLGADDFFFGAEKPGLFDAAVFAYTHLLLDEDLNWRDPRLSNLLKEDKRLVRHRKRIYQLCYVRE